MEMRLKKDQKLVEFLYNRNESSATVTYWYNGAYKDPSYIKHVSLEEANSRFDQLIKEGYKNAI
tara:strand:+ start:3557 stop:3748 length:192 start_codon:yes stop_codon:yes gene_type:complete